jgi:enamine deaminase RidA (YjgF/YER057c/UK114 family)
LTIERLSGTAAGRSSAVSHDGLVFAVATARDKSGDLKAQTRDALAFIDESLAKLGSDKSRILTATVYITDMSKKAEMNDAWLAWVDSKNPPQRACIGVVLDGRDLVEIVVCAAKK